MAIGYGEESTSLLLDVYKEHQSEIRNILSEMTLQLPHYTDLEWRLEVQVCKRAQLQYIDSGEERVS